MAALKQHWYVSVGYDGLRHWTCHFYEVGPLPHCDGGTWCGEYYQRIAAGNAAVTCFDCLTLPKEK